MTQEELDALLNSDISNVAEGSAEVAQEESEQQTDAPIESGVVTEDNEIIKATDFRIDKETSWPPPPPTTEHKVVHQLDDVTRDSEAQATEIFDKLDRINNFCADVESAFAKVQAFTHSQEELMQKLHEKFPELHTFNAKLEEIATLKEEFKKISENLEGISMVSLEAMDAMQYQDINRQKIERVINVMRSLSRYMSSLFEGKIEDSKRVSSAVYIQGDSNENVMNEDDIEALLKNWQKN